VQQGAPDTERVEPEPEDQHCQRHQHQPLPHREVIGCGLRCRRPPDHTLHHSQHEGSRKHHAGEGENCPQGLVLEGAEQHQDFTGEIGQAGESQRGQGKEQEKGGKAGCPAPKAPKTGQAAGAGRWRITEVMMNRAPVVTRE